MLLEIKNLSVLVNGPAEGNIPIVQDVSLKIPKEGMVGLVGGSGSGKTTTGLAVMRLLSFQLRIASGEIDLNGKNLLEYSDQQMRSVRGKDIGMVFQDPLSAFNPVFSIGYQIEEVLRYHTNLTKEARYRRILELLDWVGIPDPQRVVKNYPHQLSGGMRQRVMTAQAIAAQPKIIIADEPTSSLDVTLQARIIELFQRLNRELKLSVLLITHDLGVVRHLTDSIVVMSSGKVVESGPTQEVLDHPGHYYTKQLMEALA